MVLFVISVICLVWMHAVIRKMLQQRAPELAQDFDQGKSAFDGETWDGRAKE